MNLNELLVVDDNELALNQVRRIAEANGYRAVTASTVQAFKEAYLNSRPTVIVLDAVIGGEDCTVLLDFLARSRCQVPVVLLTGFNGKFLDVLETAARSAGLRLAAKVEKRKSLFLLEDVLRELRIPEMTA